MVIAARKITRWLSGLCILAAPCVHALDLSALQPPAGVRFVGATAGEQSGTTVRFIGDINGDGRADVAISAPERTRLGVSGAGVVYVVLGTATPFSSRDFDLGLTAVLGFTLLGPSAGGSRLGQSITPLGDFNGDGLDDFALAGPVSGAAAIYIVFGATGFPSSINLDASPSNYGRKITLPTSAPGVTLSRANLNNDIFSDLVVGDYERAVDGAAGAGRVTAVFGQAGGASSTVVALESLTPTSAPRAVAFVAGEADGRLGRGLADVGDFNGDGVGDVAIAAHNAEVGTGRVFVVYGRNNTGPTTLGFSAIENLGTFTAAQGMRLDAAGASGFEASRFGWSLAAADVDGVGGRDLLIGAPLADGLGRTDSGAVVGVYNTGAPAPAFARGIASLLGSGAAFTVVGARTAELIGSSVARLGDLDGDGVEDFAVGSTLGAGANGVAQGGYTQTVRGRPAGDPFPATTDLLRLPLRFGTLWLGEAAGDQSGTSVAGGGDFNGDGRPDLLIGAPRSAGTGNLDSGVTYLVLDNRSPLLFCDGAEPVGAPACGGTN
jgi:hypothetical protein